MQTKDILALERAGEGAIILHQESLFYSVQIERKAPKYLF